MNNSIYPVLGAQMKLPFYVSGVGISDPEYHAGNIERKLHLSAEHRVNAVVHIITSSIF